MELTRTDVVFSRIAMVLFYVQKTNILGMTWYSTEHLRKNNKKSSPKMKTRGPTPCSRGWGARPPWARPLPRGPPGGPPTPTPTPYIGFRGEKIREKKSSHFTIRSRRQALIFLGRAYLESIRGSGEGEFVAVVIINHPPSPIS